MLDNIKNKLLSFDLSLITTSTSTNMTQIDSSMEERLKNADNILQNLYKEQTQTENILNQYILKRRNEESKYQNNITLINEYIEKLQNEINDFTKSITNINNSPEDTLKNMEKIIDFAQILNNKYSKSTSLFDYINMTGTQTRMDYNNIMFQNKKIMDKIEQIKEMEKPYEYKLRKINENINHINKEIKLIKNFQTEINKI